MQPQNEYCYVKIKHRRAWPGDSVVNAWTCDWPWLSTCDSCTRICTVPWEAGRHYGERRMCGVCAVVGTFVGKTFISGGMEGESVRV